MTIASIGEAIVSALTSALQMVKTVASSILEGFQTLFFITDNQGATTGLSNFAIVMLVFGGVALAVGIGRLVLNLVRSKVGK